MAAALASPSCEIGSVAPQQAYASGAFAKGFIEGYNTMDALASLAFGIVVINVIRGLGVESPARNRREHREGGRPQLPHHGGHIPRDIDSRRAEQRAVRVLLERRGDSRDSRAQLFRRDGRANPRGDRNVRLPKNRRRPRDKLLRVLLRHVHARPRLPSLERILHAVVVPHSEPRPGRDNSLRRPRAHVPSIRSR